MNIFNKINTFQLEALSIFIVKDHREINYNTLHYLKSLNIVVSFARFLFLLLLFNYIPNLKL